MEIAETGSGGGLALARAADTARQYAAPSWPLPVSGGGKLGGCFVLTHSFTVVTEVSSGEARPGPASDCWSLRGCGQWWRLDWAGPYLRPLRWPRGSPLEDAAAILAHYWSDTPRPVSIDTSHLAWVIDQQLGTFLLNIFYLIEFWKSILCINVWRMPGCLNHTANTTSIINWIEFNYLIWEWSFSVFCHTSFHFLSFPTEINEECRPWPCEWEF